MGKETKGFDSAPDRQTGSFPTVGQAVVYPLEATLRSSNESNCWDVIGHVSESVAIALVKVMAPNTLIKHDLRPIDEEEAIKRWGAEVSNRWMNKLAVVIAANSSRGTALAVYHHDGQFSLLGVGDY